MQRTVVVSAPPIADRRSHLRPRRVGITLLEVLIATAILAVSLTALGQRGFVAIQAATRAQQQSAAMVIARQAMDGVLSGVIPEPQREAAWPSNPEWVWRMDLGDVTEPGLRRLTIHVRQATDRPEESTVTLTQLQRRKAS
jgi:general secretion pathway protein I